MTIQEFKKLLELIPKDKNEYKITTDNGFKAFDGDIIIIEETKTIIIE